MKGKTHELSEYLITAEKNGEGVQPLTTLHPTLNIEEAYNIQLETIQSKVSNEDEVVGKKIGLTSKAMQNLLGVDEPDYGHLLRSMQVKNDGQVKLNKVMQPKVEGEIAFVLKNDLSGPNVTTDEVVTSTDYIVPAIEIVDSRILNWEITLPDTIADNASSGLYILGDETYEINDMDLGEINMVLYKNNEEINRGKGSAALGNPAYCVAWLANKLYDYAITLKAGEVILSGALSAAIEAASGDEFTASFGGMEDVSIRFA
ncbi:2-keto-4-pentenoate hydratase [Salicibibacter kimchii]|uniref:2-keto-4-pentenoate hydratase n=1 Tax=Salicibibacter kimchii TaxID=2099786 RepID=A0A345C186_9BACI|nr:2-keto-4-pentenoate hydratase [Salicibibacter kimchii]AXF56967.1 2-keto-4-pentenoate hydratase [Salicibibacter kimchii]